MSSVNRAQRRRLLRQLKAEGCTCEPTITRDDALCGDAAVIGGWVMHDIGCVLGDAVSEANRRGEFPALVVGAPGRTGASREVLSHHARLHAEQCPSEGAREVVCSCRRTLVVVCTSCNEPVFLVPAPGPWCEHAEELVEP